MTTLKLILKYRETVSKWYSLLLDQFGPCNIMELWHSGRIEQTGLLYGSRVSYFLHGSGCRIEKNDIEVIDFEFGPAGIVGGFDSWRLYLFAQNEECFSETEISQSTIEKDLENYEKKQLIKKLGVSSSCQLYYLIDEANSLRKRLANEGLI